MQISNFCLHSHSGKIRTTSGDFKDKERGIYILYKLVFILGFYLCTPLNVQGYSIGFFEKWTQRGEIWSYILILGLI